jgi:hypothetical protein
MPETKIVCGKNGPKGSVLKLTVICPLRSMSDVVADVMMVNGADVNSFIGSGRILQTNGVTDLWRERSGYRDTGGGVVMAESTGSC